MHDQIRYAMKPEAPTDYLQCGRCGVIFHKLKFFIQHKKEGCKVLAEKDSAKNVPFGSLTPKNKSSSGKFLVKEHGLYLKSQKAVPTFRRVPPATDSEGEQPQRPKKLPRGYCGKCDNCSRVDDCGECENCLETPRFVGQRQFKKQCLLRECQLISASRVYQVEKILSKRVIGEREEYLLKWKGYPSSENCWEPKSNIISKHIIDEYEESQKTQEKRLLTDEDDKTESSAKRIRLDEATGLEKFQDTTEINEESENNTVAEEQSEKTAITSNVQSAEGTSTQELDAVAEIVSPNESAEKQLSEETDASAATVETPDQSSAQNETDSSVTEKAVPIAGERLRSARKTMSRSRLAAEQLRRLMEESESDFEMQEDTDDERLQQSQVRPGRSTKKAALDFIRSVCGSDASEELARKRRLKKLQLEQERLAFTGKATDSYETNLDLSKATSAIYIEMPDQPGKYILVKGDQDHISRLEGANLSPKVIVNAKEPLRTATALLPPPPVEEPELDKEQDADEPLSQQSLPDDSAGAETTATDIQDILDEAENFSDSISFEDMNLSDLDDVEEESHVVRHGHSASFGRAMPIMFRRRRGCGRPAYPQSQDMKLLQQKFGKRKPGRPPKSVSLARLAYLSELRKKRLEGSSSNQELLPTASDGDSGSGHSLSNIHRRRPYISAESPSSPGKRRPMKPRFMDEYIDPDTVIADEAPEEDGANYDDDDFVPPAPVRGSSGRGRGRPRIHSDDSMGSRFEKSAPPGAGRGRGKRNRVFVVMPDGTMVEVSGNDREKAIARATAKMEAIKHPGRQGGDDASVGGDDRDDDFDPPLLGRRMGERNIFAGFRRRDVRPLLEECTLDAADDSSTLKLPNTVQLVESELPLSEAENSEKLIGMYLFRQIYSPNETNLHCLMCKNKYPLRYPVDLEKHYHVIHELGVQIYKAEFSESIVFVCVPSDVSEDTTLNSGCRFCDATLKTLSEVREHYPTEHGKCVRLVPESQVTELGDVFYCSICSQSSEDFSSHHQHMKMEHRMQTYVCRFCNFCTPRPSRLRTHVKQRHLQDQPGPHLQCSVCSVYVHGKERLNKHILLSHAVQTGQKTWSCAKCLQPCGDARDLMAHIVKCPIIRGAAPAKPPVEAVHPAKKTNLFYKCNQCSLTCSSEEEIKKHMSEGIHLPPEETPAQTDPLAEPVTENGGSSSSDDCTCFLCCMRFATNELCRQHQHHVHMRWVAKGVIDYSSEELPELLSEERSGEFLETIGTGKIPDLDGEVSERAEEDEGAAQARQQLEQLENTLLEALVEKMDSEEQQQPSNEDKEEQEDGEEHMPNGALPSAESLGMATKDLPSDSKLAELGSPEKVGHYCHLCDVVIKNYSLYYLHMHNLHGLEKRFQCIMSACSRTYRNSAAFQRHALRHNQKSESYCSMCDMVFGDDEELQDHLLSPEHATKYMRVQEKYNRSEPRNYRCKVCHSWFGLFATFVKHMETESHKYQCQHCGLLFVQPGPRRNHIQSVHPELANICEICGARMQNSQALWTHLSLHSIVHECNKCHRRFLQKEQLTAHMEIHAPPTPCPWEGCNRKLSTKVGLYNHLRMHRGDADYKCSICSKGFFKKKTLECHMKCHEDPSLIHERIALSTPLTLQSQQVERVIAEQNMQQALHIDLEGNHQEDLQQEQIDASGVEQLIQLICASCLNGFESEESFAAHACTGPPTDEHGQAIVTDALGHEQQIIVHAADGLPTTEEMAAQLAGQQSLADADDLATQLARAVAEATGRERVTVSIASQPVTMSDGTIVTMATLDGDGNEAEGLADASEEQATHLTFVTQDGQELEEEEEEPPRQGEEEEEEEQGAILPDEEEQVEKAEVEMEDSAEELTSDEVALLAAQNEDQEECSQFVMMVAGEEGDEEGQNIPIELSGDQQFTSAAVMNVTTADGGQQVLLIPIGTTENGNTVLQLPPNITLADDGEGGEGNMTVSFQTQEEDGSEQTYFTLPVSAGEVGVESLLEAVQQQGGVLGEDDLVATVTEEELLRQGAHFIAATESAE